MRKVLPIYVAVFLLSFAVFASSTTTLVPTPASTISAGAAVEPTPAAIEVLQKINDKIPEVPPVALIVIGTLLIELIVRVKPTAKPKSILLAISLGLSLLASIFSKVSGGLDKVVQNVKGEKS